MNAIEVFRKTALRIEEKVARFEEMLKDPDLAPYVAALKSGKLLMPSSPMTESSVEPRKSAKSKKSPKSIGALGIRDAIRSLRRRLPAKFTAEHVGRELRRMNFAFGPGKPKKSIHKTLAKLSERQEIKRVSAGVGGKPNTYAWHARK
jgi:hypothetical protein